MTDQTTTMTRAQKEAVEEEVVDFEKKANEIFLKEGYCNPIAFFIGVVAAVLLPLNCRLSPFHVFAVHC
jgi:hypothetical protein